MFETCHGFVLGLDKFTLELFECPTLDRTLSLNIENTFAKCLPVADAQNIIAIR